jgi:16S rRNA (cytosine967-C5)-methyltransferase
MTPAARISAAVALLDTVLVAKRPLNLALKDWGVANRYAGSGDRNAVANLVHDSLRVKASAGYLMGLRGDEESSRAVLLGMLRRMRGLEVAEIEKLFSGERFAPEPLTDAERAALELNSLEDAPHHVLGDYPAWLDESFETAFGEARVAELGAMAARAPLDLRVNALKIIRIKAEEAISHLEPALTPLSPYGLRITANAEGRVPHVQSEPAYLKGAVEIQDEGSQLVALLAGAQPGEQVLDLCAGGGGKTLALGAEMNNKGQIFATDSDQRRLAPIHDRITRAGVRNVQVRTPKKGVMDLEDLADKMDLVLVDAPCTGTGTWRRHPDAKWRMRESALELRMGEQRDVLENAAHYVKPGGRLAYITCSLLDEENGAQIAEFLARHPEFSVVDPAENARKRGFEALAPRTDCRNLGLVLSPHRTNTDGFFFSLLQRA